MTAETIIEEAQPAPGPVEILFRSDRLEVRRVAAGDGRDQVVTFESYHDDAGFERPGFGQSFFAHAGFTAIHVLSVGNDWYQYPEMETVLGLIRQAAAGADRLLTYGSSMGGYAAIRFADAVGATHALALSPQYSIDPRVVSADRRWSWDQKRIAFLPRHNGAMRCAADAVVAFDPTIELDRVHADLVARDIDVRLLPLPHGGHPVATMLNELGLLRKIALAFATGPVDLAAIEAEFTQRCGESAVWLAEYAAHLPADRSDEAVTIAERAVAIMPGSSAMYHQYGMRLHEAGRYEEAIAAHRQAVAISPHPIFVLSLSRALFFGGHLPEALERVEQALAERSHDDYYHLSAARIRAAMGDYPGAWRDTRRACAIAPIPRNIWAVVRYGFLAFFA